MAGIVFSHVDLLNMLQINISLPSGRSEKLLVPESFTVGDLRILAQMSFEEGFLRLVTADGCVLTDASESLQAVGLQEEDYLTALVLQPRFKATARAFALWCCGGDRILTWGRPEYGGDSSAVQTQPKSVQQAIHCMVRTALRSKISSRMSGRCMAHVLHLLRFWQTDLL